MNDELEIIWKEEGVSKSRHDPAICLEGQENYGKLQSC
jgi:hypothetical protein